MSAFGKLTTPPEFGRSVNPIQAKVGHVMAVMPKILLPAPWIKKASLSYGTKGSDPGTIFHVLIPDILTYLFHSKQVCATSFLCIALQCRAAEASVRRAAQVASNTKVPSRVIQRRTPRPARYMYTCLQAICFCLFQTLVFLWKNRRGELISGHLELFWSLKIVKDDDTLEKLLVPMLLAWECKGRCLRYRRLHYNNVYLYYYIHRLPFGWRWHIYAMVAIFWDR